MKVTSLYHSGEVTPRYGVCKNLPFSQICGNFGACANSVQHPLRAWVQRYCKVCMVSIKEYNVQLTTSRKRREKIYLLS